MDNQAGRLMRAIQAFASNAKLDDLNHAIEEANRLIAVDDSPDPEILGMLAVALRYRYQHRMQETDINDAIAAARKAVDRALADCYVRAPYLLDILRATLVTRFRMSGDPQDIEKAIEAARHAAQLASPEADFLPVCLENLGRVLLSCFKSVNDSNDVDEAIAVLNRVLPARLHSPQIS